mmetsp:Transcript_2323/g.5726  ORF Transcript_2323/g.5726 Transcript_2323/m.5726 type:complete len:321 (-) Transcript_2323:129-1091(-)
MIERGVQKVHLVAGAEHQLVIANVVDVREDELHARVEHLGQFLEVPEVVLDQYALGAQEQLHGAEDVEALGHGHAHDRLGKVQEHEVEGAEVLPGEQRQALGAVAEPPLHPRIVEVRLGLEVLEGVPRHLLIELQSQHQLHVLVLEDLMQEHGIPPSHEDHAAHVGHVGLVQVTGAVVHERLVVMGSVGGALLQRSIEPQALVLLLQILLERHPLIQRGLLGHHLEVVVGVVVRIVARAPLELELAEVVAEVLHVIPDLAGSVRVAAEAVVVLPVLVAVLVIGAVVGGWPAVDVDLAGGLGTIEVVEDAVRRHGGDAEEG